MGQNRTRPHDRSALVSREWRRRGRSRTACSSRSFRMRSRVRRIGAITQQLRDKYALTGKPLAERLHVSLHGIGEFPSFPNEIAARAIEAAASVAMAPFEVAFDRAMSFSGKAGQLPLVLLGGGTAGVAALQQALGGALARRDSPRGNPRRTSRCSMTRVVSTSSRSTPIGWTVREFVLVHSLLGRAHVQIARPVAAARLRARGIQSAHHLRHQELRHDEEGARLARRSRRQIRLPRLQDRRHRARASWKAGSRRPGGKRC